MSLENYRRLAEVIDRINDLSPKWKVVKKDVIMDIPGDTRSPLAPYQFSGEIEVKGEYTHNGQSGQVHAIMVYHNPEPGNKKKDLGEPVITITLSSPGHRPMSLTPSSREELMLAKYFLDQITKPSDPNLDRFFTDIKKLENHLGRPVNWKAKKDLSGYTFAEFIPGKGLVEGEINLKSLKDSPFLSEVKLTLSQVEEMVSNPGRIEIKTKPGQTLHRYEYRSKSILEPSNEYLLIRRYLKSVGVLEQKPMDNTWGDIFEITSVNPRGAVKDHAFGPESQRHGVEWLKMLVDRIHEEANGKWADKGKIAGRGWLDTGYANPGNRVILEYDAEDLCIRSIDGTGNDIAHYHAESRLEFILGQSYIDSQNTMQSKGQRGQSQGQGGRRRNNRRS